MRRLAIAAAVLVLAGSLAGGASAAVALVFSKLSAWPGERMSAYQPGGLAWQPGEHAGITVYLIPTALLPSFGALGVRHGRPRAGRRARRRARRLPRAARAARPVHARGLLPAVR